jgi:aspartyl protease family protein
MLMKRYAFVTLLAASGTVWGQSVTLAGMMGGKALVIVDGAAPKGVEVGETYRGVKLVSTQGDNAVIEIAGKRHSLRVGDAPSSVGGQGGAMSGGGKIVMTAGTGGHFFSPGRINGHSVQLLVDTGASAVGIGVSDADRIGLNYKTSGQVVRIDTANGVINGWRLKLASVRVGDVEIFDVDALVTPAPMQYILLGNSFLTRFQMTRTNDQLVLERRY